MFTYMLYIFIYIYITYIYIHTYTYIHIYIYIRVCVCMCACVFVCIHVCVFHVDGYHELPGPGYDFHAACLISSARGREVLSPDTTEAPSQATNHE